MSDINEMNVGPRWYVAHTYSGYENKVKASLENIVENRSLHHLIYDIRIPVETIIEKNGDVEKEVDFAPIRVWDGKNATIKGNKTVAGNAGDGEKEGKRKK